jgi:hypothetical protein
VRSCFTIYEFSGHEISGGSPTCPCFEGWLTGRRFSIGGTTYSLGYGYNALGQVVSVVYPDGNQAIYSYTRGVVSSVALNA